LESMTQMLALKSKTIKTVQRIKEYYLKLDLQGDIRDRSSYK